MGLLWEYLVDCAQELCYSCSKYPKRLLPWTIGGSISVLLSILFSYLQFLNSIFSNQLLNAGKYLAALRVLEFKHILFFDVFVQSLLEGSYVDALLEVLIGLVFV
jgi:hypothetical protein